MKKYNTTLNKGFTLIETIIYIGLLGILMGGVFMTVNQFLDSGHKNQTAILIQEEGTFLNRKINWALTGATVAIVMGNNMISITRSDLGANSQLIINGGNGNLAISRGVGSATILNADYFKITDVSFTVNPADSGMPASVISSFKVNDVPFILKKYLIQ